MAGLVVENAPSDSTAGTGAKYPVCAGVVPPGLPKDAVQESLLLYTRKQVALAAPPAVLAIVNGLVYDLADFVHQHPGGEDLILENAGRDVSEILRDPDAHEHSETAYEILKEHLIGRIVDEPEKQEEPSSGIDACVVDGLAVSEACRTLDSLRARTSKGPTQKARSAPAGMPDDAGDSGDPEFLDFKKPLFAQIARARFSKAFYLAQVHKPRHLMESARFFDNPIFEALTRTPWFAVPVVWLPYATYLAWFAWSRLAVPATVVAATFCAGLLFWSVVEYGLHRFLFHVDDWMPESQLCYLLHFTVHGVHHLLPMDKLRLVMPPVLLLVLQFPISTAIFACVPKPYAYPFLAGAFIGYIAYDITHYFLHHSRPTFEHLSEMKTHHLAHHYKDQHCGFGVTTRFWDRVFGTLSSPT